jgi:hypothetical protein
MSNLGLIIGVVEHIVSFLGVVTLLGMMIGLRKLLFSTSFMLRT